MDTPCRFEKTDIASPIFCAWSRLESLAHRHVFSRVGLSSSSFKILALITRKRSASPSDILSEIEITKSNLSQRLRALEEKRLVRRSRPDTIDDRRKVIFLITPAGEKKLHEAALVAKRAGLSFEKDFSKEEIRHHQAFFSKLLTLINQREFLLEEYSKKRHPKQ